MDAAKRSVSLGYQLNDTETTTFEGRQKLLRTEKKTGWMEAMHAIRWALDAAGNTGQFIRFTNMKIDQHNEEIQNIKQLHDKFDKEIDMLRSQKLEKIIPNKNELVTMDMETITSMLNQLLLGKRNSKSKLKKLEDKCSLVEKELEYQELQIDDVRKILQHIKTENNPSHSHKDIDALKTIRTELYDLSKDNDVQKLSDAIDVLASVRN